MRARCTPPCSGRCVHGRLPRGSRFPLESGNAPAASAAPAPTSVPTPATSLRCGLCHGEVDWKRRPVQAKIRSIEKKLEISASPWQRAAYVGEFRAFTSGIIELRFVLGLGFQPQLRSKRCCLLGFRADLHPKDE